MQLMQVDHSSLKDNKRATTAVEDGRRSSSAQSRSEDAPVYCKLPQIIQTATSKLGNSNLQDFILHSLQVQDVDAVLCDEAAVLGKTLLKDKIILGYYWENKEIIEKMKYPFETFGQAINKS